MHLLCRADASPVVGVGHAVRALALAEASRARGWRTTLAGDFAVPWLRREAERLGFEGVDGFSDAAGLARDIDQLGVDAVAVDHYELPDGLRHAANAAGAVLLSIEDFGYGRRPADVVVNYHAGSTAATRPDDGSSVVLLGPEYAPVRPAVLDARRRRALHVDAEPLRALVVMGGTDATGATSGVLDVLRRTRHLLDVTCVGGAAETGDSPSLRIRWLPAGQPLPALIAEHDVVVCAAGVSTYETCCIGVPAALLAVVPNQVPGHDALTRARLALGLGSLERLRRQPDAVAADLQTWLADPQGRSAMARRAALAVDGRGCDRALDALHDVAG